MIAGRRADRSARLASVCAMACAALCASLSAAVLASLLGAASAPSFPVAVTGQQLPLVTASTCQDQRAAHILERTAERDVQWRGGDETLRWGEWRIMVGTERLPVRVIAVAVQPPRVRLTLHDTTAAPMYGTTWTIDRAPARTRIAAGVTQPVTPWPDADPQGMERDTAGDPVERLFERVRGHSLVQSDGRESPNCTAGSDATRDRRLSVGIRRDGSLLFVLAHFDGAGDASTLAPLGPTTAELAVIMHALGARRAMSLADGPAAQLLVREGRDGSEKRWPGLRGTPFGLVIDDAAARAPVNAGDHVPRP